MTIPHHTGLVERLFCQLPSFRGKTRIGRLLLGNNTSQKPRMLNDIEGNLFHVPNLQEPIAYSLWLDGCYEPELRNYLQSVIQPATTFIDVGANIGVFTIPMARRIGKGGRVLAIEASNAIACILRRNIALNGLENVVVCECAASDGNTETVEFFDAPISKFGMGSRAPQFGVQSKTIPSRTIDELRNSMTASKCQQSKWTSRDSRPTCS